MITLPKLAHWQFQADAISPGLYLQCESEAQRAAIMDLLGFEPDDSTETDHDAN